MSTPDALATLGTLIDATQKRDAIHIAVAPVIASQMLTPGMHVGFLPDGTVGICEETVGIVDPFLRTLLKRGDRFWLFVYPRQITSLRHVWSHPAFAEETEKTSPVASPIQSRSEKWLREYAATLPATYEELMENAGCYVRDGEYWCQGDRFEGSYLPDEFWSHYEAVTGEIVSNRSSFFSCSC